MITQWKESYERLRKQMRIETIIASPVKDFSILSMVTDAWVPSCDFWIGDYPYLNKDNFKEFTSSILRTLKDSENNNNFNDDNNNNKYYNNDDNENYYNDNNINNRNNIKWMQEKKLDTSSSTSSIPLRQKRF